MATQKISEMAPVETLTGNELIPLVKNGFNQTATPNQIAALVNATLPFKTIYVKLTQSGVSAPVITIIYNDSGITITSERSSVGSYYLDFSEYFSPDKTMSIIKISSPSYNVVLSAGGPGPNYYNYNIRATSGSVLTELSDVQGGSGYIIIEYRIYS